jgi:hypothetical protein
MHVVSCRWLDCSWSLCWKPVTVTMLVMHHNNASLCQPLLTVVLSSCRAVQIKYIVNAFHQNKLSYPTLQCISNLDSEFVPVNNVSAVRMDQHIIEPLKLKFCRSLVLRLLQRFKPHQDSPTLCLIL